MCYCEIGQCFVALTLALFGNNNYCFFKKKESKLKKYPNYDKTKYYEDNQGSSDLNGDAPMSPGIARQMLKAFHQSFDNYELTNREIEILQSLSYGNSYKLIAAENDISIETVRRHLQNIYQKLHVQSATEAV